MYMNISFINLHTPKYAYYPTFCAKKTQKSNVSPKGTITSDVVEINSTNYELLPKKFELTETEALFDESLLKLHTINSNIKTQKENLRDFYSPQDKADYKDLLKERKKLNAKLDRIAKQAGADALDLEVSITTKKIYNRLAPKILRAKSKQEILQLKADIDNRVLFLNTRKLLESLINQCLSKLAKSK